MPEELAATDVQNILNFMSRVELKGSEAQVYVGCQVKLHILLKKLQDSAPPPAKIE